MFRPYCKYIFPIVLILLLIKISLFYIILTIIGFFILNLYSLNLYKNNLLNYRFLYILLMLLTICIITSNFLFENITFMDSSQTPFMKFVFLLPIVLFILQYIHFKRYNWQKIIKIKLDILTFSIITIVLLLLGYAIMRSGNYYLPASTLELKARNILENLLYIRPRFKEIIFYPFLFIFILFPKAKFIKNNFFLLYLLALIGFTTTFNSFLHIHTLSYYSILRTLTGIGIALIIVLLSFLLFKILINNKNLKSILLIKIK